MNQISASQLKDRLEGLGTRRHHSKPTTRSLKFGAIVAATFALGAASSFGALSVYQTATNPFSKDGLEWLTLEIAEKHQLTPAAAQDLIEVKLFD